MADHVFVVSEWLPKENCEKELSTVIKKLSSLVLEKEKGCVSARVTKQISHPGSPGKSKYTIVCMQEYVNIHAFDMHCATDYVADFFKTCVENEKTALVKEWTCRLFAED